MRLFDTHPGQNNVIKNWREKCAVYYRLVVIIVGRADNSCNRRIFHAVQFTPVATIGHILSRQGVDCFLVFFFSGDGLVGISYRVPQYIGIDPVVWFKVVSFVWFIFLLSKKLFFVVPPLFPAVFLTKTRDGDPRSLLSRCLWASTTSSTLQIPTARRNRKPTSFSCELLSFFTFVAYSPSAPVTASLALCGKDVVCVSIQPLYVKGNITLLQIIHVFVFPSKNTQVWVISRRYRIDGAFVRKRKWR